MAFDPKPPSWIASMSEDGTDITIPIASLTGLTATDADATTGDIRVVAYRFLDKLLTVYDALPEADKPVYMKITKSSKVNTDLSTTYTFSVVFNTATTSAQEIKVVIP